MVSNQMREIPMIWSRQEEPVLGWNSAKPCNTAHCTVIQLSWKSWSKRRQCFFAKKSSENRRFAYDDLDWNPYNYEVQCHTVKPLFSTKPRHVPYCATFSAFGPTVICCETAKRKQANEKRWSSPIGSTAVMMIFEMIKYVYRTPVFVVLWLFL